jgi:hypothetical protein
MWFNCKKKMKGDMKINLLDSSMILLINNNNYHIFYSYNETIFLYKKMDALNEELSKYNYY